MLLLSLVLAASNPTLVFADQQPGAAEARVGSYRGGKVDTLARVATRADYTPLGSVSPDGHRVALMVVPPGLGHPERAGQLYLLDLDSRTLVKRAEHLVGQERPRFSADGTQVLCTQLRDERQPEPQASRRGELATAAWDIVSVPVAGHGEQVLHTEVAYGLNLAGVRAGHVVYYLVTREGAAIHETELASGASRQVAALPDGPFARDFSVVGSDLIFATAHRGPGRQFALERLDLDHGALAVEAISASDHLTPIAVGETIFIARPEADGDALARGSDLEPLLPANGARNLPLAASADGTAIAVRREETNAERLLIVKPSGAAEIPVEPSFSVFGFRSGK